jgi:hypothetical protein
MDIGALVTALVDAKVTGAQLAIAGKMLRINADAAASIVQLLEASQENLDRLANLATGIGGNLDISV